MAILTLDAALAGMQPPIEFMKSSTPTIKARTYPLSLLMLSGIPGPAVIGVDNLSLPKNWTIVSSSVANPTVITVNGHPWSDGDLISISGHTGSTPDLNGGPWTITKTGANTFTIPNNVTVGGTGGVACGRTNAGGDGLSGYELTSLYGQLPFTNPPEGKGTYLARFVAQSNQPGTLMLCDRLWHNGGIDVTKTTTQTTYSSTGIPSRDDLGGFYGHGVYAAAEVLTALTLPKGNLNIFTLTAWATDPSDFLTCNNILPTYTSADGNPATSPVGTFYEFDLDKYSILLSNGTGVTKFEEFILGSAGTAGTISIVFYRVIAALDLPGVHVPNSLDCITSGFPKLYNDSVPFLVFIPGSSYGTTATISGHIIYTIG